MISIPPVQTRNHTNNNDCEAIVKHKLNQDHLETIQNND